MLVVVPALNEAGKIGRVVRKAALQAVTEVVVVDDGSRDGTAAEAREAGATVITHPHNRGVGAAIRSGIDHGLANGFDAVVVLSGDDQHDPSEVPRILSAFVEHDADLVQGSRWLPGGQTEHMPRSRQVMVRGYSLVLRLLTGFPYTDGTNGFRGFRLSMLRDGRVDLWQAWLDTYELEPYLLYRAAVCGYRICEVPSTVRYHHGDAAQYTKMKPLRDWWRIVKPLVYLWLRLKT